MELVIASVEVPYDMKEEKMMEDRGRSSLEIFFDHTLQIVRKRPFGYKDTSFPR